MAKNDAHDEHRPKVGLYLLIFGALLALTCLTVVISKFHLPRPQAIALGLLVAGVKASLVGAVFMHLWGEHKFIHKILGVVAFCASILVIVLIDCGIAVGRLTDRVSVAEQRPAEAAEGVRDESVALPADVSAAKAAEKSRKGKTR